MENAGFNASIKQYRLGNKQAATKLLNTLIEDKPNSANAYSLLARISLDQKELTKAKNYLKQAIAIDASNPAYHHSLGNIYKADKKYILAEKSYLQSIVLDNDYLGVYNSLGGLYYLMNRYYDAIKSFSHLLQQVPDNIEAHFNLGLTLLKLGKHDAAAKQFKNVLAINPGHIQGIYHSANLSLLQNNLAEAKSLYLNYLDYDPENTSVLNNLGVISIKLEKAQEAISYFTRVLMLDNQDYDARSNLANLFMHHHRYENAITHLLELLAIKPKDSTIHYSLGMAYFAVKDLSNAYHYLALAHQAYPDNVDVLITMATINTVRHEFTKAQRHLLTALTVDKHNLIVSFMLSALTKDNSHIKAPLVHIKNTADKWASIYSHGVEPLPVANECLANLLTAQVSSEVSESNLLQLGCGTGMIGKLLINKPVNITGIDISADMLEIASSTNAYLQLINTSIIDYLRKSKSTYEMVIAIDVMHTIGDMNEFCQLVSKRLTKSGKLIFSTILSSGTGYELTELAMFLHNHTYVTNTLAKHGMRVITYDDTKYQDSFHRLTTRYYVAQVDA